MRDFSLLQQVLDSLVVRIPACHAGGRGSIPRRGGKLFGMSINSRVCSKNFAPPGNRTRVARMGILHDTTTPAAHCMGFSVIELKNTKMESNWPLEIEPKIELPPAQCSGKSIVRGNLIFSFVRTQKCGTLHDFACHPCAGAMLIFSVSFQF